MDTRCITLSPMANSIAYYRELWYTMYIEGVAIMENVVEVVNLTTSADIFWQAFSMGLSIFMMIVSFKVACFLVDWIAAQMAKKL